jgi:hypothetical protein
MHDLTISGGTITESGPNYAFIDVASPGTVILGGQVYTDTKVTHKLVDGSLPIATVDNIVKVDGACLVRQDTGDATAQLVYDYYRQRLKQNFRLYGSPIKPGDIITVASLYGKTLKMVVEKVSTDAAGGCVQDVEAVGVEDVA